MAAWFSHIFESACHSEAVAGSSRKLSACSRLVGPRALPCQGQTGITWHARACRVPQFLVTVSSLLDTAVRLFLLSLNTCSHEDLTINNVSFKVLA